MNGIKGKKNIRGTRAVGSKHLDGIELGFLGYTVNSAANGASHVGPVAVAVGVGVISIVGEPGSTAAKVLISYQFLPKVNLF